MPKFTLVTSLRPDPPPWQRVLAEQKQRYAAQHGYGFIQHEAIWESPIHGKLDLFARHLSGTDWLAWMDADVYIAHAEIKLEEYIEPQTSVVFGCRLYCLDPGMLLLANDKNARFYLERVRHLTAQWRLSCNKPCHAKCGWFLAFNQRRVKAFARLTGDLMSTHPDNPYPRFTVHAYDRLDKEAIMCGLLASQKLAGPPVDSPFP